MRYLYSTYCIAAVLAVFHSGCRVSDTPCRPNPWVNAKRDIRNKLQLAQMTRDARIMKRDTGSFYKPDHETWQRVKGSRNAEALLNNSEPIVGEKISLPNPEKLPYPVRIRGTVAQAEVEVDTKTIEILCWDHGSIDGDIITLFLDNRRIKTMTLKDRSKAVPIHVRIHPKKRNLLLMFANNEGSVSPNTASLSVNNTEVVLSANQKENAALRIKYRAKQ